MNLNEIKKDIKENPEMFDDFDLFNILDLNYDIKDNELKFLVIEELKNRCITVIED